ncbi:MAG TPA: hypothetical protein VNA19_02370 [Pyrinomonadaceae bacterium]|nr:hypothetical protein [Pyrinomonadaceae bacterium]
MRQGICAGHVCAISLLLLLLGFPANTPAQSPAPAQTPLPPEFVAAMKDAEQALTSEISRNLTPIREERECPKPDVCLQWERGRVLVVYWTSNSSYEEFYKGKENQFINLDAYTWVTVVPELRNRCKALGLSGDDLTARLKQLLGLHPFREKSQFVEMWVDPRDIFRPCPDPEISDHECETDFSRSRYLSISLDYIYWYTDMRDKSYLPDGLPWTRLGYTYDWGNPSNHVGMSEFVIPTGARVKVREIKKTADYCR